MDNTAVQIVTIKNKFPLFKGTEEAGRIELIELKENGFDLVSQKDLYKVGDKAVYIQPDYNLSEIVLFESFLQPGGEVSKSMLGKVNGVPLRIRAKKFNLSREIEGAPVYSNGILLPYEAVVEFLEDYRKDIKLKFNDTLEILDLTEVLGITKYEEPEVTDKNGNKTGQGRAFPEGIYKTDETNINNLWNYLENNITYPVQLVGTEKVDGSSLTMMVRNGEKIVCSRNLAKNMYNRVHDGRRKKTLLEKLMFWTNPDLNKYKMVPSEDNFVVMARPILELLDGYNDIVLRGELNGGSNKGSGNKYNPASKKPANIKIFGIDYIVNGVAVKCSHFQMKFMSRKIGVETVKEVFNQKFNSKEEIQQVCEEYFKANLIEGIVIRTLDSTFSAKYMNNYYDSKK